MSDDPATILEVSGGSHGLEASYDAMRALADTYDSAGDRMRDMARLGGRTLGDRDLLESSLLSPATAIRAETAVLEATAGSDGILVESVAWEVDAAAIRGSVTVLESADQARHDAFEVIDHLLGRQLGIALVTGAPVLVAGVPLALTVGGDGLVEGLEDLVTDNPLLVQHLVNGGGGLLAGLTGGLLPTVTTNDAADVLGDLYPEGRPHVVPVHTSTGDQPSSVEDLLDHLSDIAALSQGADSAANGTIEIQTVTNADGQVVHIVNLPGTDDLGTLPWTADDDVRDLGTNLDLVAGEQDDYQQGILEAMHQAGIDPDHPVLIVGHSQGGMEAAAILASDSGFNVTDVVTAGSPTAQVGALPGRVPRPVDRAARRPGAAARRRAQPAVGRADDRGRRRPSRSGDRDAPRLRRLRRRRRGGRRLDGPVGGLQRREPAPARLPGLGRAGCRSPARSSRSPACPDSGFAAP